MTVIRETGPCDTLSVAVRDTGLPGTKFSITRLPLPNRDSCHKFADRLPSAAIFT